MNELVQKTKEHKIFNKLEEKHSEKFLFEQSKQELGFIDELATQKFVRRKK
jgi:flagellar export protein FliJ